MSLSGPSDSSVQRETEIMALSKIDKVLSLNVSSK